MASGKTPWRTENWWVSHWNFHPEVTKEFNPPKKVIIHDITMRDGEQEPGVVFNVDDKIRIAEKLAEIGVQRIEGGMVAVSPEDREAVKQMVKRNLGAEILAFCRAMVEDVKMAVDCGVNGVVIEIPGSEHGIRNRGKTVEWAQEQAIQSTHYAHEQGLWVTFFTIDATRAEENFYFNFLDKVIKEGHCDGLAAVDTIGVLNPQGAFYYIKQVKERIDRPLEVHFHNNFGLAVANTIAGVLAGGEVIHTTINGLGGSAGNCPMAETVMSLLCLYGIDTGLDYSKLKETTNLVAELSGRTIPPNRPIVGDQIYTTEIGLGAASELAARATGAPRFQVPNPEFTGHAPGDVVMGKKAGNANVQIWAEEMGIELNVEEARAVLAQVKRKGGEVRRLL
ncbi:pyruvate carboxyltransferase, partial [Chloroflexota bacterium]